MTPTAFHFLRPEWLLALIAVALIVALAIRRIRHGQSDGWSGVVDAHLMPHLTVPGAARRGSRGWIAALCAALIASVLAMAGPTWERLPVPVHGGADPTVIVLSLAQSMNGTDLVPSRLTRAVHKLRDMLTREKGGDIGLVIFADRPFVAAPLTADAEVIRQMLPDLSTDLMPVLGNRLDLAITEAQGLLSRAQASRGRIVVIADDAGPNPAASVSAAGAAQRAGYAVNVLGVGTVAGAELHTADGRAITGPDGQSVIARLDVAGLTALAQAGGGQFSTVTPGDADIASLLPTPASEITGPGRSSDLVTDSWHDVGYLLLIIPVLLAPFAFRRGLFFLLPLLLVGFGMAPGGARAEGWRDLTQTPDQQGQSAFDAGQYAIAAQAFRSADHKAAALYRAEDFEAAAALYGASERVTGPDRYNLGNALAKAGQFEKALAAYDGALNETPDDADARFNRDLVARLVEQQKQENETSEDQKKDQQSQPGGEAESEGQKAAQPQDSAQGQDQHSGDAADGQQGKPQESEAATATPGDESGEPAAAGTDPEPRDGAQSSDPSASDAQLGQPGEDSTDQTQTPQTVGNGSPGDQAAKELKNRMDLAFDGDGTPAAEGEKPTAQASGPALDQAAEQQLRAVPDDPSGLLRARIRQHYARLRAASQ